MQKYYYYIPLLFFLVLIIFFARQLFYEKDPSELPSALLNKKLPELKLDYMEGNKKFSSEYFFTAEEPYLINVWASWCAPCKVEHEYLMELKEIYGATIYGINYKDRIEEAEFFLESYGNPFKAIGIDNSGRVAINLGVYGVPETFIIDKFGFIKYRHVGPIQEYDMHNTILPILKKLGERIN
tara:strand:+ start:25650 stop:26198 length:549 start_codon:yes stop_codon:yes gene_type:complete